MERLRVNDARGYSDVEYAMHIGRYLPVRDAVRGRSVLDACCGEGYAAYLISAAWGAKSTEGVDISAEAIDASKQNFVASGLSFVQASLEDYLDEAIEKGRKFDVIVSVETLEHVDDPLKILRGFKQILADDGLMYLTLPNDYQYYGQGPRSLNKYHKRMFDFAAAKSLAEEVFGKGEWAAGTVTSGFSIINLSDIASADELKVTPAMLKPSDARMIPASTANALLPDSALYYAGLWDSTRKVGMSSASVIFPATSEYRIPKLTVSRTAIGGRPLRVMMVGDVKGWAFDNIAQNIKSTLDERVTIDICHYGDYTSHALFDKLLFQNNYDHIHFLWRPTVLRLFYDEYYLYEVIQGMVDADPDRDYDAAILRLATRLGEVTLTCGVYDHLLLTPEEVKAQEIGFALIDGYTVSSKKLLNLYASLYNLWATVETPDGVDRHRFKPKNLSRLAERDRPLMVGWVGNSDWNKESGQDPKGVNTVLNPALEQLAGEGLAIKAHYADRKQQWRSYDEMAEYYSEIDVLTCSSSIEGTPNPILEAMSCGVPIVSTDVGIVSELLGPAQQEFIVAREIGAFADALRKLCLNRSMLETLSKENLTQIDAWGWIDHAPRWLHLFATAHANHRGGRRTLRTSHIELFARRHLEAFRKAASEPEDETDGNGNGGAEPTQRGLAAFLRQAKARLTGRSAPRDSNSGG